MKDLSRSLPELQKQAHDIANKNGFWDTFSLYYDTPEVLHRDVTTKLALIADEAHEALSELRSHEFDQAAADSGNYTGQLPPEFGERSEEHTSELQSRFDLVCRLLLEKK